MSQGSRPRLREGPAALAVSAALHNPWVVAVTVSLATFMEVLDSSIANVSLPHIAGNLGVSLDESTWVLTTYLVANVIILPISGWISNTVGRKPFFLTALSMFTLSSVACGMAPDLRWLVFFRVLQGLGGGGLAPVALSILVDSFPIRQRGLAMSIYGITVVVAPILGPLVGGWITDNYTWRWVFFINLPVGIVALSMTSLVLPATAELSNRAEIWRKLRQIDFTGLALFAVGLGTLEVVYDRGDRLDWFQSKLILWLSVMSATALVGAVIWELRHPRPIVNLRLYKDRNFMACSLVMFIVFATLYGTTVLLPLMLQTLMGYTATQAGWVLSPGAVATLIMMPVAGWMMARGFDARWLIIFSLLVISGALYWMTGLNLEAPMGYLIELRVVQTFALAFFFVPIQSAAYLYLPKNQINNATGMVSMVRNEGASLGVAILNTLLGRRAQFHQLRLAEHVNLFSQAAHQALAGAAQLAEAAGAGPHLAYQQGAALIYGLLQRQAMALAYLDAFMLFSIMALAVIPLVFLMRRSVTDGRSGQST